MTQLIASGLTLAALFGGGVSWDRHYKHPVKPKRHHHHRPAAPLSYATASWYQDAGATASGYHVYYGVANRTMAFGTKVLFVYHGRSVLATVDDRGPYIYDRTWDLNQNVAGALAFGGVDVVGYRIGG
jgi:rare lipoprotein A (peptidoglycan hydrolase)